jgi:hypothetical protein
VCLHTYINYIIIKASYVSNQNQSVKKTMQTMDHGGGGGTDEATTTSLQHLNDDDMVAEILLRLPSVSVFRCRACVGHGMASPAARGS